MKSSNSRNLVQIFDSNRVSERLAAYLMADSIAELGLKQPDLESAFYSLVKPAIRHDTDVAVEIVLKTGELIRTEEETEAGWCSARKNGQTHLGVWLDRLRSNTSAPEVLAFDAALFAKDGLSQVPFDGVLNPVSEKMLLQTFIANGGNYTPAKAAERLFDGYQQIDSHFLIPYCVALYPQLLPWQRTEILELGGIEWQLGFRIAGAKVTDRSDDELVAILADDSISLSWRMGLAAMMAKHSSIYLESVGVEIGNVIAASLKQFAAVSAETFLASMDLFLRTGEGNDQWRGAAESILDGWVERNQFAGESPNKGRALNPSFEWCTPIMDLACRIGSEKMIEWNQIYFRSAPSAAHGMVVSLIRNGYFDRAYELLFDECVIYSYQGSRFISGTGYDERLTEATPEFLESIDNHADRQFAAFFLASVPDNEPTDSTVVTRIEAAFNAHKPLLWQPDESRNARMFEFLAQGWGSRQAAACLAKYQVGLDVCVDRNPLKLFPYWGIRVELFESRMALEKGESFPWLFNWGRTCFETNETIGLERQLIVSAMVEAIELQIRKSRDDRQKHSLLLKVARKMLATVPQDVHPEDLHRLAATILCSHALNDEMEEYHQWWSSLDQQNQQFYQELFIDRRRLIDQLREQLSVEDFASSSERLKFIEEIAKAEVLHSESHGPSFLAYVAEKGLVLPGEILPVAENIARNALQSGSAPGDWFCALAGKGTLDEAIQMADELLAEPELSKTLTRAIGLEKAVMLISQNRDDDARQALNSLKTIDFEGTPGYGEGIIKLLEKRLSN